HGTGAAACRGRRRSPRGASTDSGRRRCACRRARAARGRSAGRPATPRARPATAPPRRAPDPTPPPPPREYVLARAFTHGRLTGADGAPSVRSHTHHRGEDVMSNTLTVTAPEGVPFIDFEREFDAPVEAL